MQSTYGERGVEGNIHQSAGVEGTDNNKRRGNGVVPGHVWLHIRYGAVVRTKKRACLNGQYTSESAYL